MYDIYLLLSIFGIIFCSLFVIVLKKNKILFGHHVMKCEGCSLFDKVKISKRKIPTIKFIFVSDIIEWMCFIF